MSNDYRTTDMKPNKVATVARCDYCHRSFPLSKLMTIVGDGLLETSIVACADCRPTARREFKQT